MHYCLCLLFVLASSPLIGQIELLNMRSVWDDRLTEWEVGFIDNDDEMQTGYIQVKWPLRNDWEDWTYEIGKLSGVISTKWKGDWNRWELRGNNSLVEIRQRWRNDPNEWIITCDGRRILLETDYRNNANAWMSRYKGNQWIMYTEYLNDARDWIIEDGLWNDLSLEERVAMAFIGLIQSIPKN